MMNDFKSFEDFQKEQHTIHSDENIRNEHSPGEEDASFSGRSDQSLNLPSFRNNDQSEAPIRQRKPHRRRFKLRFYALIFSLVLVVIFAGLLFLPIPFGSLVVSGSQSVSYDDVVFEGQVRQPVNVLQISSSDLQNNLKNDLRIADVTVKRTSPFTMTVQIEDRKPVAIIQGEFGYSYVDKSGLIIEQVSSIKKGNLPMITGVKLEDSLLGDEIKNQEIQSALTFLNHLSPEGEKVFSEINIGNPSNIMAYTRDGLNVRLGSGEDMAAQAELAENMVGDVKARKLSVEYIQADLSSPFIKLKK